MDQAVARVHALCADPQLPQRLRANDIGFFNCKMSLAFLNAENVFLSPYGVDEVIAPDPQARLPLIEVSADRIAELIMIADQASGAASTTAITDRLARTLLILMTDSQTPVGTSVHRAARIWGIGYTDARNRLVDILMPQALSIFSGTSGAAGRAAQIQKTQEYYQKINQNFSDAAALQYDFRSASFYFRTHDISEVAGYPLMMQTFCGDQVSSVLTPRFILSPCQGLKLSEILDPSTVTFFQSTMAVNARTDVRDAVIAKTVLTQAISILVTWKLNQYFAKITTLKKPSILKGIADTYDSLMIKMRKHWWTYPVTWVPKIVTSQMFFYGTNKLTQVMDQLTLVDRLAQSPRRATVNQQLAEVVKTINQATAAIEISEQNPSRESIESSNRAILNLFQFLYGIRGEVEMPVILEQIVKRARDSRQESGDPQGTANLRFVYDN